MLEGRRFAFRQKRYLHRTLGRVVDACAAGVLPVVGHWFGSQVAGRRSQSWIA